jgi:transcriptional regulator with XRE-family HTH domain/mannose-6-phosphate isomerase-like protein (cupin superfamily)
VVVGGDKREGVRQEPGLATMGGRLRRARTARGISLRSMARRVGVSPSLISQVETGRAKPSVNTLYALASELGISLDELLFPDAMAAPASSEPGATDVAGDVVEGRLPHDPVQRAGERATIRLGSGVVWERLTSESLRDVDFLYVTYEVGGASSPSDAFQRHTGIEWGYILSGTLRVDIGFDAYVLGPGDAVTFDSAAPHRLSNDGPEPVHAVWFVLGRGSPDAPDGGQPRSSSGRPSGRSVS